MARGYQYGFSKKNPTMYMMDDRQRKAITMVALLKHFFKGGLESYSLLDVGSSTGIIDDVLSDHVGMVAGIDIDTKAILHAQKTFNKKNLVFNHGDAMNINYASNTFDIAICANVYEHVPDSEAMMKEIYRVLKPGGVCYFSAANRLIVMEPHYRLPLLSILPKSIANIYLKICNRGDYYHECHLSYWGLKSLVKKFILHDFTKTMIADPDLFHIDYMVREGSLKQKLALFVSTYLIWLVPGYIWVLQKPINGSFGSFEPHSVANTDIGN